MKNKLILAGKILVPFVLVIASLTYLVGKFEDYKESLIDQGRAAYITSQWKYKEELGSKFVLSAQEAVKQAAELQKVTVVGFGNSTTDIDATILRGEVKVQNGNKVVVGKYCFMKNSSGQPKRVDYDVCKMFWGLSE